LKNDRRKGKNLTQKAPPKSTVQPAVLSIGPTKGEAKRENRKEKVEEKC